MKFLKVGRKVYIVLPQRRRGKGEEEIRGEEGKRLMQLLGYVLACLLYSKWGGKGEKEKGEGGEKEKGG